MEPTLLTSKTDHSLFLTLEESADYLRDHCGLSIDVTDIRRLAGSHILPTFAREPDDIILREDLLSIVPALVSKPLPGDPKFPGTGQFWPDFPASLNLGEHTRIDTLSESTDIELVFYSSLRNLISWTSSSGCQSQGHLFSMSYVPPVRLFTYSEGVHRFVEEQQQRARLVGTSRASQFSNSAYYMGSKRVLSAFIVEALSSVLPKNGTIIDLMCGSGATSGAFSRVWRTMASDSQKFCQVLAQVQGGGFSTERAQNTLSCLLPMARDHAQTLRTRVNTFLEKEDRIFHGDVGPTLLNEYKEFVADFPTVPRGPSNVGWDPVLEVKKRRGQPTFLPYCLFTAYFANLYFGLRQCVEIDSLRFAIDQIKSQYDRDWALGALIATMSALGTSYAGHFAQPVKLSLGNLSWILEKRSYSIMHEFSVRLLNLAEESEKSGRSVEIVPGPWSEALSRADKLLAGLDCPIAVYLDAPYKREEYSRYYHVLETAIVYSYPSCIGNGKIPDKKTGERFQSEFFTRSGAKLNQLFVEVISQVVNRGWICAWSYSESGSANMVEVIKQVSDCAKCWVKSYAAPYQHKAQSGQGAKNVTEYLIVFVPSSRAQ